MRQNIILRRNSQHNTKVLFHHQNTTATNKISPLMRLPENIFPSLFPPSVLYECVPKSPAPVQYEKLLSHHERRKERNYVLFSKTADGRSFSSVGRNFSIGATRKTDDGREEISSAKKFPPGSVSHLVCVKLRPDTPETLKQSLVQAVRRFPETMGEYILASTCGPDLYKERARGFELAFLLVCRDEASLER